MLPGGRTQARTIRVSSESWCLRDRTAKETFYGALGNTPPLSAICMERIRQREAHRFWFSNWLLLLRRFQASSGGLTCDCGNEYHLPVPSLCARLSSNRRDAPDTWPHEAMNGFSYTAHDLDIFAKAVALSTSPALTLCLDWFIIFRTLKSPFNVNKKEITDLPPEVPLPTSLHLSKMYNGKTM